MSLKPVLVVIPQRTLRLLSGLGSSCNGCPPVLVARRQANTEQQCNTEQELCATGREIIPVHFGEESSGSVHQTEPSRSVSEEEGEGEGADGGVIGGSGDEAMESEDAANVAPSRAVKHKAVEQRRKKKISDAIQQLLEALQPPSPAGKMTRAEILERAVDKIKTLKEENEQLKAKIDNLPQPGKETELYSELSKQITEFLTLKSQLEHVEKQTSESHYLDTESHDLGIESYDLGAESHDFVQDQDQTITSIEQLPAATCANPTPSSTVTTMTSSSNSTSTASANTTSCSVACVHVHGAAVSSQSNVISTARITNIGQPGETTCTRIEEVRATEAPPPASTHQPWPVTSILSQDNTNYCQHAMTTITSYHGNRSLTTSGSQTSTSVAVDQNTSTGIHLSSFPSISSPMTSPRFHQPVRTLANGSVCLPSSAMSSDIQQRNVITNHHLDLRAGRNNVTTHSRTGGGLASLQGNYQYHCNSEPQQVIRHCEHSTRERRRELGCGGGYSPSNQTRERYHSSTTHIPVQPHTSAIVQPWVESSHRPHPLHHVTNATPTPRISPQYNIQHHQEQHRRNVHTRTERFMPYPYPRVNHHSSSSTSSWLHDNHMITPTTSSRDIAPQGRSYVTSPYQQHFSTQLGGRSSCNSNYDYSRNYSTTQGHPSWMPYFTPSQQNSSRSSSMMSHDTQATPPYPIQPHPHGSGSSGTSPAVWRPYSERTRSSGFCLADILSLPSETEATPLSMEVTPPTGHQSFLVNRLLDDI